MASILPIDGIGVSRIGEGYSGRGPVSRYAAASRRAGVQSVGGGPGDSAFMEVEGDRMYAVKDKPVALGSTGIQVEVRDAVIERPVVYSGGRQITLPAMVERGAAMISAGAGNDFLDIRQDREGNTVLSAAHAGEQVTVNLGAIASLQILSGGGSDDITIQGKRYFGGVQVDAGSGNDTVSVSVADALEQGVTVSGGAGNDHVILSGEGLNALVRGNGGDDVLDAQELTPQEGFALTMDGGDGNDLLWGSPGDDDLIGGAGADWLAGYAGNDHVFGGSGDDWLYGQEGNDWLYGAAGNDVLAAGVGDDSLVGGDGDDALFAGSGVDRLIGGDGVDTFGPLLQDPKELYVLAENDDLYTVSWRHEMRTQPVITSARPYQAEQKYLYDYDSATDYLVDRTRVR